MLGGGGGGSKNLSCSELCEMVKTFELKKFELKKI